MNFSRLPDNVFLKILEYLPLEDCIRAGRVNKSFRRFAQLATSHTKYLDLTENRFRNLTPDQLAIILGLCASNLERFKFGCRSINEHVFDSREDLVSTFAQYECPRLIDINLSDTPIDRAVFDQLIRNCPNMESLEWQEFNGFPAVTINSLKKLRLNVCNDASLQTLIDRCPNLEELDLDEEYDEIQNDHITAAVLDQFFGSIQHARLVNITLECMDAIEFEEAELVNFYKLPLTKLDINFFIDVYVGDVLLHKVATSFPHLRELSLCQMKPTNAGISWLGALQELHVLKLDLSTAGEPYDHGIHQLAHCGKLRKLDVQWSEISGGTLVNLLRSCPQLEYVHVWDVTEVDNSEQAVVILESLAGIPKRDITIGLSFWKTGFKSIWEGEPATASIKKLEEDEGLKIKFI